MLAQIGAHVRGVTVPFWSQVNIAPFDDANQWNDAAMATRLRVSRRASLPAMIVALTATAVTGCASSAAGTGGGSSSPDHGTLSDREFAVAYDLARAEVDKAAKSITSATATVGPGIETENNVGPPCTSGTLLHIKLIGAWNIVHGGLAGRPYEPVSTVLVTADPESGKPCLLSVQTGQQEPDRGATVLFTH
jgi:hypothetical protein